MTRLRFALLPNVFTFVFCFYASQTSKLARMLRCGCPASHLIKLLFVSWRQFREASAMLHLDLPHEDREPELPRVGLTRKDELQADCWLWVCLKFPLDWTVYLMCTCKGWNWFCDQRELYDIHRSPITWPHYQHWPDPSRARWKRPRKATKGKKPGSSLTCWCRSFWCRRCRLPFLVQKRQHFWAEIFDDW